MGTLVLLVPGIADGNASLSLKAPAACQHPAIAVLGTQGQQVALKAAVLGIGVQAEGELEVADVIVAVDNVGLDVSATEKRVALAEVAAEVGGNKQVAQLLVLLRTRIQVPGLQTAIDTQRPGGAHLELNAEVGCMRGIVEQVVADGDLLAMSGKCCREQTNKTECQPPQFCCCEKDVILNFTPISHCFFTKFYTMMGANI